MAGDSEGNDDWSTRLPAQWLERDGRKSGGCLTVRCVRVADDTTWSTKQLRYTAGVPTTADTSPTQASSSSLAHPQCSDRHMVQSSWLRQLREFIQ